MNRDKLLDQTIKEILREIQEDIKEIKTQTQKTNGRVSSLEVWRGFITGGVAILAVLVIPLLISIFKK